jgi:hypothetical protein
MGRACSTNVAEEEYTYIGYWWDYQKKPLGRPRRRRVDNVEADLRDIG